MSSDTPQGSGRKRKNGVLWRDKLLLESTDPRIRESAGKDGSVDFDQGAMVREPNSGSSEYHRLWGRTRGERAKLLLDDSRVKLLRTLSNGDKVYVVKSQRNAHKFGPYTVNISSERACTCSCEDYARGGVNGSRDHRCKHILACKPPPPLPVIHRRDTSPPKKFGVAKRLPDTPVIKRPAFPSPSGKAPLFPVKNITKTKKKKSQKAEGTSVRRSTKSAVKGTPFKKDVKK